MKNREWMGLKRVLLCGALGLAIYTAPALAATVKADADAADISAARIGAPDTALPAPVNNPASKPVSNLALSPSRYPVAHRDGISDHMFGETVADPWRWLEGDIRSDHAVADWVRRENGLARGYLAALPGRNDFAAQLRTLYNYERYSLPRKAGHRYFFLRNSGLMNQSALYVRDGLVGADRPLIDPNRAGVAYALDAWVPSPSGRYLAYSEQHAGSDWRTIRVVDADNSAANGGKVLADRLEWANDTLIGWVGDGGFLYSRYPAPRVEDEFQAQSHDKAIWFHRVGTGQDADELVYATPDHPDWGHKAQVTADGHWAVISTEAGTGAARAIHLIDLSAPRAGGQWTVLPLVPGLDHDWKLVDGMRDRLWFITNDGAPNNRLVRIDLQRPDIRRVQGAHPSLKLAMTTVMAERHGPLETGRIVGDRLILSYLVGGQRVAVVTDLNGRPAQALTITGNGAATGFNGHPGDSETFYQYSSYNQPPTIYRMDLHSGRVATFAKPSVPFDPANYVIEARQYPSRDGTMVPITIVRKRAIVGRSAPTLLYGYGGFDIALNPGYSPWRMAWLEAGGVFAVASVRGGGELGPGWYEAGRGPHKQNSFDDFIAAGEYLVRQGIARKDGLAAQGGSNGGMMVAAVINQRPDLFVAANPDVGVMDMLRFDRFTQGRSWIDDYGNPAREADWRTLRAYSPYHNIAGGHEYPAILVTTADTDDRVVPAHSFKYVAALQAAAIGDRPHLLRVESDAGHGGGRPLDKTIASGADVMAFLAAWTGLTPPAATDPGAP